MLNCHRRSGEVLSPLMLNCMNVCLSFNLDSETFFSATHRSGNEFSPMQAVQLQLKKYSRTIFNQVKMNIYYRQERS